MAAHPIEFIARGLLVEGSRILLCQNLKSGYYYLPGGHVEFGESAAAALERELKEEGGITAKATECLFVHENSFETRKRRHHEVNAVFHVEHYGPGEIVSLEPDISLEWVELASLVDLDLRPEAMKAWLVSGPAPGSCTWASSIER